MAGCYVPLIFGIEPNIIGIPILENGDFAVDVGIGGSSTYRWDEKTLLISPGEKMNDNTIGGNLSLLNTIGIRGKSLTDKQLFLKGYMDASRWYAEYILYENFEKKQNWCEYIEDYDSFKKKI